MKFLLVALLLLSPAPALAGDDCPPGGVKHAALTGLDHASMEAAYHASFVGIYHREPSGVPGSGPDDTSYWISTFDHYGPYGDSICRAGWNAYTETKLAGADAADPKLGDQPARFQPQPAAGPSPAPVPTPNPIPSTPSCDLSGVLVSLDNLRADLDAGRAENQAFFTEARSKWEAVAAFVGKYGPIVLGAIFAGRATK